MSKSRIILLTGCTKGIGRALTEQFIQLNHTVIACGRSKDEIAKLTSQFPSPHHFSVVDVTDHSAVQQWASNVIHEVGVPDLLINNAAIINRNANLWEVPVEEFDQLIDINIKGVANVMRAFLTPMITRRSGVIVNLSSGWGRSTSPLVAPYCASKWAIEGLTKALADELPSGMAAVPLSPGMVHTEMLESCFSQGASNAPKPTQWAKAAAPYILNISPADNGKSLTTP